VSGVQIGESFIGDGADAAHVNTVLGHRDGPVGAAWATALATPSVGHVPFVAVVAPGVAVKPLTLFVSKAAIAGETHGDLTWGAAQAGVAGGVADAVADGVVSAEDADELALVVAVWVNPAAADAEAVYRNNRTATRTALANGHRRLPELAEVAAHAARPTNPFYTAPEDPRGTLT
jgi:5,6,7,8-tetrahydromethanopterin hydro-lyase